MKIDREIYYLRNWTMTVFEIWISATSVALGCLNHFTQWVLNTNIFTGECKEKERGENCISSEIIFNILQSWEEEHEMERKYLTKIESQLKNNLLTH